MTKKEFNEKIAISLEKERLSRNLTQADMAKALDLSLNAYKRIINCEVDKIDSYCLYKLRLITGCNLMVDDSVFNDITDKIYHLSPQQQLFISSIVDFESQFKGGAQRNLSILVPSADTEDGMIWDSVMVEKMDLPIRDGVSCGIKITSNHLNPVYVKGDIILISRRPIRDGDTGIFVNKDTGRAYIRKFRRSQPCILDPLNAYGESYTVNDDNPDEMDRWIKFGVVVSRVRQ